MAPGRPKTLGNDEDIESLIAYGFTQTGPITIGESVVLQMLVWSNNTSPSHCTAGESVEVHI